MRCPVAVLTLLTALLIVPDARAVPATLKGFTSCGALVDYGRAGAERTGGTTGVAPLAVPRSVDSITPPAPPPPSSNSPGGVAPTAAPVSGGAGDGFSGTNVQERGVDEPDLVKTDGRRVFAVIDGALKVIDVTGAAPVVVATMPLEGVGQQLLLRGTRLLVIARAGIAYSVPSIPVGAPVPTIAPAPGPLTTTVTELDVSDPAAPKVARTMTVPGAFVDARQHGGTARLVIDSSPVLPPDPESAGKRVFLGRTVLKSNLSGRTFIRDLTPCTAVRRPLQFSGLDVLAILTIDLDRGMYSLDRDGVMAGAEVVYGSADSLYVASRRWVPVLDQDGQMTSGTVDTEIHRFDISDPDHTVYRASGTVPGFILNSYALSEWDGDLRVATTEQPPWLPGGSAAVPSSTVSVLRQDGSVLKRIGSVGGLGQGQRVYAVRFIGDRGYVVTFRQVDPLYALDLSAPTAPVLRGALELPGYSAYLHPISDTLLLGIGREGADEMASLFDVSDPASPRRVSLLDLGQAYSSVDGQPHAFLFWPKTGLAVIPLQGSAFTGAMALHAGAAPLREWGRIAHPVPSQSYSAPIERSLVIGSKLYTLSYEGLAANALNTMAPLGFTSF